MKAIYINLDPYLAQIAAWLKGGKSGPAPTFQPLPLAVTIPLGESACIYLPSGGEAGTGPDDSPDSATISGQSLWFWSAEDAIPESPIAVKAVPGLSVLAPSAKYYVVAVTGDTTAKFAICDSTGTDFFYFSIPVLVRRETASGPVDLVDFTPPATAPSAADIKSALVAAGNTALEGVCLNGTKWLLEGETDLSSVYLSAAPSNDNPALAVTSAGS